MEVDRISELLRPVIDSGGGGGVALVTVDVDFGASFAEQLYKLILQADSDRSAALPARHDPDPPGRRPWKILRQHSIRSLSTPIGCRDCSFLGSSDG